MKQDPAWLRARERGLLVRIDSLRVGSYFTPMIGGLQRVRRKIPHAVFVRDEHDAPLTYASCATVVPRESPRKRRRRQRAAGIAYPSIYADGRYLGRAMIGKQGGAWLFSALLRGRAIYQGDAESLEQATHACAAALAAAREHDHVQGP